MIRAFAPDDEAAARALLASSDVAQPHTARLLEILADAARGSDDVSALVAGVENARGHRIAGIVLYGFVAGAAGAGIVRGVLVAPDARRVGIGIALVREALTRLLAHGARLVVAELPDDPSLRSVRRLLERCDFHEDARVPDLVRDGVDLVILRASPAYTPSDPP